MNESDNRNPEQQNGNPAGESGAQDRTDGTKRFRKRPGGESAEKPEPLRQEVTEPTGRPAGKRTFTKNSITVDELRSRQEAKQRKRFFFYIFLFVFILLAFLVVSFFVFFRIGEIRITGNRIYTNERILEHIAFKEGDNLFSFDAEKAESTLRKNLPYIGAVRIERKMPSVVIITVEERTEDLALRMGEETYLLSGDLQVLARMTGSEVVSNIATLYTGMVGRCIVGESLTFPDRRAEANLKELYACLKENNLQKKVKSIDFTSRFDITVNYDDRFTVYFGSADNLDIKVRFLVAILERLGSGEKGYINLSDAREAAVRLDD